MGQMNALRGMGRVHSRHWHVLCLRRLRGHLHMRGLRDLRRLRGLRGHVLRLLRRLRVLRGHMRWLHRLRGLRSLCCRLRGLR